jgi:hypothetical protein
MKFFSLSENNWQESACQEVLESMRQCCLKWKDKSLCCEGIDLNKEYKLTKEDSDKK